MALRASSSAVVPACCLRKASATAAAQMRTAPAAIASTLASLLVAHRLASSFRRLARVPSRIAVASLLLPNHSSTAPRLASAPPAATRTRVAVGSLSVLHSKSVGIQVSVSSLGMPALAMAVTTCATDACTWSSPSNTAASRCSSGSPPLCSNSSLAFCLPLLGPTHALRASEAARATAASLLDAASAIADRRGATNPCASLHTSSFNGNDTSRSLSNFSPLTRVGSIIDSSPPSHALNVDVPLA
mmetsp:Transcript_8125/g.50297  ORF Transcript_8125/g.50297 Transcript_8125/m.50297 type:complete len:245 (-) Transcript_8125:807-1541(-)